MDRAHATKPIDGRNKRPLALDLFCGGGGASAGLWMAGFDVIGIDIEPQPDYPFPFIQADALSIRDSLLGSTRLDFIWASPPCQQYSTLNNALKRKYPDLVAPVRDSLRRAGVPWIIENVPGAPFIEPVALTGDMFGLGVIRRRHFESSRGLHIPLHSPERGKVSSGECVTVAGDCSRQEFLRWQKSMDIYWMKRKCLSQAVPPAYAWYLARQFIE